MDQSDQIQLIINKSIDIIEIEIETLEKKQDNDQELSKQDTDKVIDILKTLLALSKDIRAKEAETPLDQDQEAFERAVLEEAKKIKDRLAGK